MAEQPQDNTERPTPEDAQESPTGDAAQSAAEQAEHAIDAASQAAADIEQAAATASTMDLPDFSRANGHGDASELAMLADVSLKVKIELGRTRMYVEDVLRLNENSIVELDKAAGDPVDIFVNDRLVARGEVLVVNENFCVRVSEIVGNATKAKESA